MIDPKDASAVADVLAKNLLGVAKNPVNFQKLPDSFWGYFARGHDKKGGFGIFVAYSEDESDIDGLIGIYEQWVAKNKPKGN